MKKTSKGLLGVIAGALAGAAIFKYFQNKQAAEEIVVEGEDVTEVEDGTCEGGCCCCTDGSEKSSDEQPKDENEPEAEAADTVEVAEEESMEEV